MTKDDLDLIDALVWAGCLSRPAAREVAQCAPDGKVATFITERGLAPLTAHSQTIIERLAKYERETDWDEALRRVDNALREPPETD